MGKDNVVEFPVNGKYEIEYIKDAEDNIIGVSHPSWPFTIMRNQKTKREIAFVCDDTDEPFGVLDADVFNTVLLCWLLIDDPNLIDESVKP
jgi:hypothetical protein